MSKSRVLHHRQAPPWLGSRTRRLLVALSACLAIAGTIHGVSEDPVTYEVVASFPSAYNPDGGLTTGNDGALYGTTREGGTNNKGTLFRLEPDGTLTTLHSFSGADGRFPDHELVKASDGRLHGTTHRGGDYDEGTVFRLEADGTVTSLHSFDGYNEGAYPSGLMQASDGLFYGTTITVFGPPWCCGAVFRMDAAGNVTVLHRFNGANGSSPGGTLLESSGGRLYGTTAGGGANSRGTVFRLDPDGSLTTLHSFTGADGTQPSTGVIRGADGRFYGLTWAGGTYDAGTVFRMEATGAVTTLFTFRDSFGARPSGGLIQASDGRLYGTTRHTDGVSSGDGTVFMLDMAGALTTLHRFGGADGSHPLSRLIRASDGRFYGTTYDGGANGGGVVFRLALTGSDTTTTLSVSPSPSSLHETVRLTARVAQGSWTPTGHVEFFDGATSLGFGVLVGNSDRNGYAVLNVDGLVGGTHLLSAHYLGDLPLFRESTSPSVEHVVTLPPTLPLTVTLSGSGSGTVTSTPEGITCPGTCSADFPSASLVTLNAVPSSDSDLTGWYGACSGRGSCTVTMNAEKSVEARFMLSGRDLVVASVSNPPSVIVPGSNVAVSAITRNRGAVATASSTTRFYLSADTAKSSDDVLLSGTWAVPALAAGAQASISNVAFKVPAAASLGTYYLLACADDTGVVAETNETNNCLASATQVLVAKPDLVVTALGNPPAAKAPGGTFTATDTVQNAGAGPAAASTSRYYLSLDQVKGTGDVLLTGTRAVPALAASAASSGSKAVTIPATAPLATYYLIACADDLKVVTESTETNNCRASTTTLLVALPDLATASVGSPPARKVPGSGFSVTDSVQNTGAGPAGASTSRYHLSADLVKDAGDVLLTGTRAVPALGPGAASSGSASVTIPLTAALGMYHVLACADDLVKVMETNEANNCAASSGVVLIGWPDLVETAVSNPPAQAAPGGTFTIADTVQNQGDVGAGASTSRYFLSVDAVKDAGDVLLTGTRSVPTLAPGATSAGSKVVTVPVTAAPGTYYVLACADNLLKVKEGSETNNCTASASTVVITP